MRISSNCNNLSRRRHVVAIQTTADRRPTVDVSRILSVSTALRLIIIITTTSL
jgi:outer membrane receptor for monomeric catechols